MDCLEETRSHLMSAREHLKTARTATTGLNLSDEVVLSLLSKIRRQMHEIEVAVDELSRHSAKSLPG